MATPAWAPPLATAAAPTDGGTPLNSFSQAVFPPLTKYKWINGCLLRYWLSTGLWELWVQHASDHYYYFNVQDYPSNLDSNCWHPE